MEQFKSHPLFSALIIKAHKVKAVMFTCKSLGLLWTNCQFWKLNWPWQPINFFVPAVTHTPLSFMYFYASAVEQNKSWAVCGELKGCGYRGEKEWHEEGKKSRFESDKMWQLEAVNTHRVLNKRITSCFFTQILLFLCCWGWLIQFVLLSVS